MKRVYYSKTSSNKMLQPAATDWWPPWRRSWWPRLCIERVAHALADLVRWWSTMAINNAAVVACCRLAHRVIALPVSQAFLSIRKKICLK